MYADVQLKVDLTPIEERLDDHEDVLLMFLEYKRMMDLVLVNSKQDGDPVVNKDGIEVVWTPDIKAQVEAGIKKAEEFIAKWT